MGSVSPVTSESTRNFSNKGRGLAQDILHRLARVKNTEVAKAIGRDESTVSRIASEELGIKLSDLERFFGSLGLKVVPHKWECYDPEKIEWLRLGNKIASSVIQREDLLTDDDPE